MIHVFIFNYCCAFYVQNFDFVNPWRNRNYLYKRLQFLIFIQKVYSKNAVLLINDYSHKIAFQPHLHRQDLPWKKEQLKEINNELIKENSLLRSQFEEAVELHNFKVFKKKSSIIITGWPIKSRKWRLGSPFRNFNCNKWRIK